MDRFKKKICRLHESQFYMLKATSFKKQKLLRRFKSPIFVLSIIFMAYFSLNGGRASQNSRVQVGSSQISTTTPQEIGVKWMCFSSAFLSVSEAGGPPLSLPFLHPSPSYPSLLPPSHLNSLPLSTPPPKF